MARMSDFHVVGDPRFAPDAPEGGGGVSKEYVDNADNDVKKTSAKGHNSKYNESVIPSQYNNKLYVYGNPESMYHASDIGGEIPEITQGHIEVGYNWWGQLVPNWHVQDNRIYDDEYNRLCAIKVIDQQDANWAYWFALCFKSDESIIANPTYDDYPGENILYGGLSSKQYFRAYSGQPPVPQEWVETTAINYITGGKIRDTANGGQNYNYGCQVSGIPIFVVNNNSQTEWDKVNHYITTGDYSNASNYRELYPDNPDSFTAIDVISGDWYTVVNNAWVKQGTLALNSAGGTEVEANPIGEPTDTLSTISIDGVIYSIEGGDVPVVETELIPLMTSNTTPSGTVSYSSQFGTDYAGYMAFNRQQANISMMTGGWLPSNSDTVPYLQYTWDSPQKLSKLWIETANNGGSVSRSITVQGYDGTSWENCLKSGNTVLLDFENGQYKEFEVELNGQNYSAIKIEGNEQWFFINSTACTISRMQVYSISGGSGGDVNLSDLSDVDLTNLSDGQILQYNSTTEKWENADNQGSLPFEFVIDPTDNGINIVYDDGGE